MNTRVQRLREKLAAENVDALLITTSGNRRYVSGFTGSGYLIISQEHAMLATDFRYWEQMGRQSADFELIKMTQGDMKVWLPPILKKIGARTLGFESHDISYAMHETLKAAVGGMPAGERPALKPTSDAVEGMRIFKDDQELAIITRAVEIADHAFETVAAGLEPGMTERQIAWELEKSMREQGAEGTSFSLIVAAGPNAALPHHRPSDKQLQMGEPLIIDMGARLHGYCSDLSRTVCLGKPDKQFRRVYDIVLAAQETAIAAVQSGMTGHQGDKLARDVIEKAGHGDHFGHSTGHGVGLDIHENPRVARNASHELSDGMIFTIEPGVYIPGWGGVRIEDIVILENGKARDITRAHKRDSVLL